MRLADRPAGEREPRRGPGNGYCSVRRRCGMAEQVDIAVDLGAVPPPLPEILNLRQLVETAPAPPPQIIEGLLHQGCKMILGGTSKSNKSWCLLDLALSVPGACRDGKLQ